MKIQQLALGLATAAMMSLTSCVSNDYPTFDDADAFVAMTTATAYVEETGGELEIPVMLTSLSGIEATVEFALTPAETAGAIEGTHYTLLNSSKTLTFTKDEPIQYIKFRIIDNDTFDGDVRFTISLLKPEGLNLGADTECVVTIGDNEHPLANILGNYTTTGTSYWDDELVWSTTIEKDANDINKVWITGLLDYSGARATAVYGTVNEEKTTITIPLGQEVLFYSSSYECALALYDWNTGGIVKDGTIVGNIAEDGTITFPDSEDFSITPFMYSDGEEAGYWDLYISDIVLKKN